MPQFNPLNLIIIKSWTVLIKIKKLLIISKVILPNNKKILILRRNLL